MLPVGSAALSAGPMSIPAGTAAPVALPSSPPLLLGLTLLTPVAYPDDPCLTPPAPCDPRICFAHPEGFLFVTAAPPAPSTSPTGYVAVWRDFAEAKPYVFARRVFTHTDLGHAILRLETLLSVDRAAFTSGSTTLLDSVNWALADAPDATTWAVATRGQIATVLGFGPGDISDPLVLLADDDDDGGLDVDDECGEAENGNGVPVSHEFTDTSLLSLDDLARELGQGIDCCDEEACCDDDGDCGPGEHCVEGECYADECDDENCPPGQPGCECPPGQHCEGGECVTGPCDDDGDCAPGQGCVNGDCTCEDDDDCPSGDACVDGVCEDCPGECCDNADCDDGNPCTGDYCRRGECHNPCGNDCIECTIEGGGGSFGYCIDCICNFVVCDLSIAEAPDTVCAGSVLELVIQAACLPDCTKMDWSISVDPIESVQWIDPGFGEIQCDGAIHEIHVFARVGCSSSPSSVEFEVEANLSDLVGCVDSIIVGIEPLLNLSVPWVPEEEEESPGVFMAVNRDDDNNNSVMDKDDPEGIPTPIDNDLIPVILNVCDIEETGTIHLDLAPPTGVTIRAYESPNRQFPINLPRSWEWPPDPEDPPPLIVYLEGINHSQALRDNLLRLQFTGSTVECEDRVALTVFLVDLELPDVPEEEEDLARQLVCVNQDYDENKEDLNGSPLPDLNDASPISSDGLELVRFDLEQIRVWIKPDDDDSLAESSIVLDQFDQDGRFRVLGTRNAAAPPYEDDWTQISSGSNLRDEFFLSTGAHDDFGFWLEGLASGPAEVRLTFSRGSLTFTDTVVPIALDAKMASITSGIDPIPVNPALIAPLQYMLPDFSIFSEGNQFRLTTIEPGLDLTQWPVFWDYEIVGGAINAGTQLIVDADRKGARFAIPTPSQGNFGQVKVMFLLDPPEPVKDACACLESLARNAEPDVESKDHRYSVRLHLCRSLNALGTSRTAADVRAGLAGAAKVLSQAGIHIKIELIVITFVPDAYLYLDNGFERNELFTYDEHEVAVDIYFVPQIQGGDTAGWTLTPSQAGLVYEAGIAVADSTVDGPLQGQDFVRTIAHEITHYLMNNIGANTDHRDSQKNLMYPAVCDECRDLDEGQCLEIRSDSVND